MREVVRTVGELREALAKFPDDTVPFSWEHPPFTGVCLVPQNSGKLLIGPADDHHAIAKDREV